jgi:hypothetical protein
MRVAPANARTGFRFFMQFIQVGRDKQDIYSRARGEVQDQWAGARRASSSGPSLKSDVVVEANLVRAPAGMDGIGGGCKEGASGHDSCAERHLPGFVSAARCHSIPIISHEFTER